MTGLIHTFGNLNIGGGGTSADATKAAAGIGEALITTAGGMLVAIIALVFFRISVVLQAKQADYFAEVGSELELIYQEVWYEPNRNLNWSPAPYDRPEGQGDRGLKISSLS